MTQLNADSGGVLAISGGVGGAKLALGLYHTLPSSQLAIIANTADDFEHLGLSISPDLDTLMYTLAGVSDPQRGWGLANETFHMMEALATLGGESWFQLGDRDLATHLERSRRLRAGETLTSATAVLCRRFGIDCTVLPMSDDPVRTMVQTAQGELAFQHYFVREQCRPAISGYRFEGIERAATQVEFMARLRDPNLRAVIICPSNPFVSVAPLLSLPGVRAALAATTAPVVAVSPIVGGAALKGPAAKMMAELGLSVSPLSVAEFYGDLLDGMVIDQCDVDCQAPIRDLGMAVCCTGTVMTSLRDRQRLAQEVLTFIDELNRE